MAALGAMAVVMAVVMVTVATAAFGLVVGAVAVVRGPNL